VPGGGVDKRRRQWKKKKGKYLFNKKAMAKVFRARFLTALNNMTIGLTKVNKGYLFDNIEFIATQKFV